MNNQKTFYEEIAAGQVPTLNTAVSIDSASITNLMIYIVIAVLLIFFIMQIVKNKKP